MKTKHKRLFRIGSVLVLLAATVCLSLPYYARQALIHWMPVIDDAEIFHRDTVRCDTADTWHWPLAGNYNRYRLSPEDSAYLDELETVSFLVIRHDSILFEDYRNGWNDTLTSNIYSATKTIVGLLAGIAADEGYIHSIDDPVSEYIPEYVKGKQADVTIRDLLTMSGGMDWDESYASLFSVTTHRGTWRAVFLPQRRDPASGFRHRGGRGKDSQPVCGGKALATHAGGTRRLLVAGQGRRR